MTRFAVVLFSLALADLIAGFSGRPRKLWRCMLAWAVGVGAAVTISSLTGLDVAAIVTLGALLAVFLPVWFWVRAHDRLTVQRGALGFWGLMTLYVGLIATGDREVAEYGGRLESWIKDIPLDGFESPERVMVGIALVLFLLATANGVVRLILAMSGASPHQERRLRGGRMIGPLERLLIFGFVVAGQITAAVLVVSAKTLLRFPEASREAGGRSWDSHRLNEYLVVGSLGSWVLAFAAAAVLRGASGA